MAKAPPNKGSASWLAKHPQGPLAKKGNKPRKDKPKYPSPSPGEGPVTNFMPFTPEWEAGQRQAGDELSAALAAIAAQRDQIPAWTDLQTGRMATDEGYAHRSMDEGLVDRGMFDSGTNPYLRMRDIYMPYGRQRQDLAFQVADLYSQLSQEEQQAQLAYLQAMSENALSNASLVAQDLPLGVSQYAPRKKKKPRKKKGGK